MISNDVSFLNACFFPLFFLIHTHTHAHTFLFIHLIHLQGTSCPYRHEPAALGHEQMCPKWKVGQCLDPKCPNRHMIIEKTRGKIQCYWESKPSGCCKPHCVFKHTKRQNNNNNVTTSATIDSADAVPNSVEPTTAAAGLYPFSFKA